MEFNVLVAEPSDAKWTALSQGIRRYRPEASLLRVKDGEQALRFLFHTGLFAEEPQTPSLVLLTAELPIVSAETVVARLRQHPRTHEVPVIVVQPGPPDADFVHSLEPEHWLTRQPWLSIVATDALERNVAEAARQLCSAQVQGSGAATHGAR